MDERQRTLVSAEEENSIERTVVEWLNEYTEKPGIVEFAFLSKTSGICISPIQSPFLVRKYITGGHKAQFTFQIVYRLLTSCADERLAADELLNAYAAWAETNAPSVDGITNWKTRRDNGAALMERYDNNAEDHAIQITITYEVI